MRIAIIGAGASGCFCAVHAARMMGGDATIDVFEAGSRPMAKLSVTGGGRCNLTNTFRLSNKLSEYYPRGDKLMRRLLRTWSHEDTMSWFETEGVELAVQPDECVFPASQDAMQIVDVLRDGMDMAGVRLHLSHQVSSVSPSAGGYELSFTDPKLRPFHANCVVISIGGCPTMDRLGIFHGMDIGIVPPVPSLYTFNIDHAPLNALAGTVVQDACLGIAGTRFSSRGILLLTHWGVSGPATLRLSSYAARYLADHSMQADLCINWMGSAREEGVCSALADFASQNPSRMVTAANPTPLTHNLWNMLAVRSGVGESTRWADVSGKRLNRLASVLTSDVYRISGKGRYKEEFVTCGGVALSEVDYGTLGLKRYPGAYVTGEVLDLDAVTGGFNLQAAWSTGYVVARSLYEQWAVGSEQ